jgi:hypothetical protein
MVLLDAQETRPVQSVIRPAPDVTGESESKAAMRDVEEKQPKSDAVPADQTTKGQPLASASSNHTSNGVIDSQTKDAGRVPESSFSSLNEAQSFLSTALPEVYEPKPAEPIAKRPRDWWKLFHTLSMLLLGFCCYSTMLNDVLQEQLHLDEALIADPIAHGAATISMLMDPKEVRRLSATFRMIFLSGQGNGQELWIEVPDMVFLGIFDFMKRISG